MKHDWHSFSGSFAASHSIRKAHSFFLFTLPLCIIGGLTSIGTVLAQQVTSDGTVSTTVITPDGKNFTINDGTTRGGNLFHSFKEFSIPTGGSANFNNAANIQNIISRVTGGSISTIDGLIKANGAANLFLLNPAGIIFGPNASLQIGGSFLGSTANSLLFDNGFEFSATDPQAPPLLTISIPIGLRYRDNPQNITTESTTTQYPILEVPEGKTLALIGGNVSLDRRFLLAPGGRIELGGLSTAGTVGLNGDGSLSFPVGVQRADVSLNGVIADVREGGGGSIAVYARNLDISGGSGLYAGIRQGFGSVGSQAGDITLNASGTTTVANGFIYNRVNSGAVGNAGNLTIETGKLNLSNGGQIAASTFGTGNAGNLTVNASDSVDLNGEGQGLTLLTSQVNSTGRGNAGELVINTKRLSVRNGAQVSTNTFGIGNAGNLTIRASDSVELSSQGGVFARVASQQARGTGGNLTIETGRLSVTDGSRVSTSTLGEGNAGNLLIKSDSVELNGEGQGLTLLTSQVNSTGRGNAGELVINTKRLSVTNGAEVLTSTFGIGNAGNLTIRASDSVELSNQGRVSATVQPQARGTGGNLTIETGRLSVRDGSQVSTGTSGEGNGGNLLIKARDLVEVLGTEKPGGSSDLGADVRTRSGAKGGDLTIDTKKLVVRNAQVGTSVLGKGEGGNFTVRATDSVELSGKVFSTNPNNPNEPNRNPAGLFAQINFQSEGKSGNLTIETNRLSISDGAKVQVATFGQGNAGNLFIRASDIDLFETANANFFPAGIYAGVQVDDDQTIVPPKGNGGNITIETDRLRVRDGGRISSNTEGQGDAGTLLIRAKESVEVSGKTLNPNAKFVDGTYESRISAGATSTSTGSGGSLKIDTGRLIVRDSGRVTVSSENTKPAGQLEIYADSIKLDNQGSLTATTQSGNGGNIILGVRDFLLLRRNSNISTSAGLAGAGGDGGNITINSASIVAFPGENSDITANAFNGSGGKVTINTSGLFGIAPLSRQELERRLNTTDPTQLDPRNLPTNDITAISQNNPNLSGTVNIITPNVDPTRGLFELSETVIDPAQQIAQHPCIKGFGSTFTITGRGGLPTDPNKILSNDNVRVDLIKPVASTVTSTSTAEKQPSQQPTVKKIIPAQGWIFNEKGEVLLVGYDPTKTGVQRQQPAPTSSCAAVK
jgi:filamentous hemagglutinin family protein